MMSQLGKLGKASEMSLLQESYPAASVNPPPEKSQVLHSHVL